MTMTEHIPTRAFKCIGIRTNMAFCHILEIQIYISRVGRGIPACKNRTQNLFRSPRLRPTPWHSRRVGE